VGPGLRALAGAMLLIGVAGCGASVIPEVHSEQERLSVAKRKAAAGEIVASIEMLKAYIDRNAGAGDIDGAIFLLGECYLKQKEWTSAQLEFERLLRDYPESDSSGSASFKLGEAMFGQSRGVDFDQEYTEKALTQWQEYRTAYPGHWRNAEADKRILEARTKLAHKQLDNALLYVKLRMPVPARRYYQKVMDEYGDLAMAGEAEFGMARCDLLEGKKELAIQRLAKIEADHPGQPAAEVARRERLRVQKMKSVRPVHTPAHPIPDTPQ
jgi:outer membrane assembly lipoprotein YfiO